MRFDAKYEESVRAFKKMMNLSWMEKDTEGEVSAYGNLAIGYYYLGVMEKCEYYHDRYIGGKTENNLSIAKQVACNQIRQKRLMKENDHSTFQQLKLQKMLSQGEIKQRLPSPSGNTKGTYSKTINLLPHFTEYES